MIARTPAVVRAVQAQLPEGFAHEVADTVFGGLLEAAKTLEGRPAS